MSAATSGFGISYHPMPEFHIRKVISDSWTVFTENFFVLVAIYLVSNVLISPILWLVKHPPAVQDLGAKALAWSPAILWIIVVCTIAEVLIVSIISRKYRGQASDAATNFQLVKSRALPVVLTVAGGCMIVGAGFLALIIPAFIVLTAIVVAVPVCILEDEDPIASLQPSAELTRSHRWSIFVSLMGFVLLGGLASIIVQMASMAIFAQHGRSWGPSVANWTVTFLINTFMAVFYVVLYWQLRAARGLAEPANTL